jgi:transposase
MWRNALSHGQAATEFNIRNPADVGTWERGYRSGGWEALLPAARGRPKQMPVPVKKPVTPADDPHRSREELLTELNYLRMENAYLKKLRALVLAQQKATAPKKRK